MKRRWPRGGLLPRHGPANDREKRPYESVQFDCRAARRRGAAAGFHRRHGIRPDFAWNTAPALIKRLQAGETADLLILNRAGMDAMQREDRILAGSEVTLASSPAALAVKAARRDPDISTARR